MATEIYYFSGTGNSFFAAKELQKRLPKSKLVPIVSLLNNKFIESKADVIGFVFPVHFARLPIAFAEFLKKAKFPKARYFFAVATRVGSTHRSFVDLDNLLKPQKLDAFLNLNMASNDPKFRDYKPAKAKQIRIMEARLKTKLDAFKKFVLKQEPFREIDTEATLKLPPVMLKMIPVFTALTGRMGVQPLFYSDGKCIGCGTCANVCLSGKIKMVDKKPVWQKDVSCFNCYACLNYCPQKAVQMKSSRVMTLYTEENPRYSHPYATAKDIARQKA